MEGDWSIILNMAIKLLETLSTIPVIHIHAHRIIQS